jgi:parvulin-like peptidyl-prolyl isomerase
MEDTVATVNGQPILLSEYDNALNAALDQWKRSAPAFLDQKGAMTQLRERTLDQMIDDKLLEEEAEKRKIKIHDREIDNGITEVKERNFRRDPSGKVLSDPEVEALFSKELKKQGLSIDQFRDRIRRQLMVRKLIDEVVRPKAKQPDDKELQNTFEKLLVIVKGSTSSIAGMPQDQAQAYLALGNRLRTLTAERVRVSHILIKLPPSASMVEKNRAMKKIMDIRKMVENGGDFAELARKYSEDAESAPRGGDLDFILRGWMPKEFEKAAFGTPVGEVSQPVETQFGYHLIRVQEKKASENLDFDKIKDDLAQFLYNMNLQTELEKLVKSLREQARIETNLPKEKDSAK